mgnify:FL=1
MNLILLGPPGSGKGTQAKLLADHFGLKHISSGQLLRQAGQNDPNLQKILDSGELVPYPTVLSVIEPFLASSFVLDGTPRNLRQAQELESFFNQKGIQVDLVIYYDLPDEDGVKRLLDRAQKENRSDDTPKVIKERYHVYHQATEPVIKHYQVQNKLVTIDARPDIKTIFQNTLAQLQKW